MTFPRLLTWIWVALLLGVAVLWVQDPTRFTAESLERVLREWGPWAFGGWVVASMVRGMLLIPSTPVVIAGGVLFPNALPLVLLVSMAGIALSGALLYRFPGYAEYDSRLAARYPAKLERLKGELRRPWAMWFVAAWAFFPATPTDLICYAAGLVRMPFRRMMMGLMIGELPLVTAYVLLGQRAAAWFL